MLAWPVLSPLSHHLLSPLSGLSSSGGLTLVWVALVCVLKNTRAFLALELICSAERWPIISIYLLILRLEFSFGSVGFCIEVSGVSPLWIFAFFFSSWIAQMHELKNQNNLQTSWNVCIIGICWDVAHWVTLQWGVGERKVTAEKGLSESVISLDGDGGSSAWPHKYGEGTGYKHAIHLIYLEV